MISLVSFLGGFFFGMIAMRDHVFTNVNKRRKRIIKILDSYDGLFISNPVKQNMADDLLINL